MCASLIFNGVFNLKSTNYFVEACAISSLTKLSYKFCTDIRSQAIVHATYKQNKT